MTAYTEIPTDKLPKVAKQRSALAIMATNDDDLSVHHVPYFDTYVSIPVAFYLLHAFVAKLVIVISCLLLPFYHFDHLRHTRYKMLPESCRTI